MTDRVREALERFLSTWDDLPAGGEYSPSQIQNWLSGDRMGDAVSKARKALASEAEAPHLNEAPVAYAYEYEEFNGQWMRTVILATEGGSGRLCAPPKTHDSKPVRNVRPLYSR